ncbi:MAG: P27 family phage terminase small subunit [Actinomycetota bacterium]|nr:P27 family phage terminase small subunit [Actinomycetota bacterium]
MAESAGPARRYSWAPFAPGHTLSLAHGVYSPRSWKPLAAAIAAELPDLAPWCSRPTYGPAVAAWARTEAQVRLVEAWLDEHGPLDTDGVPRPAAALLARLESRAQSLRAELGLSPLAHARLLATFATTPTGADDSALDALMAAGREVMAARAIDPAPDEEPIHALRPPHPEENT